MGKTRGLRARAETASGAGSTAPPLTSGRPGSGRQSLAQPRGFPPTRLAGRDAEGLADRHGYLHDLRHQVGTIAMLAAALDKREDLGPESRTLTAHLLTESRRLDELVAAISRHPSPGGRAIEPPPAVRLDDLVRGLAEPFRVVDGPQVRVLTTAATVRHNPLALWRALRNLLDNARTAAGVGGRIDIWMFVRDGFAVVDIADDGPGLPTTPARDGARGLAIVETLAGGWGGWVEFSTSRYGGCRSRLFVPLWHEQG